MSKNVKDGPSPQQWEISRRRMLRNLGAAAAAVPFAGFLTEALTDMPANASPRGRALAGKRVAANAVFEAPFASHPGYKFTFVNHVTTNPFFMATIYGLEDTAAALGIPKPQWTGSQNSIVSEMVGAMNTAIAANVNGVAVALIDPVAFNTPTNNALGKGIPVISYNAGESGNKRMAYVGQNNITAGQAAANRIVSSGLVSKGDLVAMIIATPGTGNIQPRIDGAKPIFQKAGYQTVEVAGGAAQTAELAAVESWYLGHQNVKFMYAVDSGDSIAVATTIAKHGLKGKVGGSRLGRGHPGAPAGPGKSAPLLDRPAGVPAGLGPDVAVVPLQPLRRLDEARQHRHRPRLRDSVHCRRLPAARQALRGQRRRRHRVPASQEDQLANGAGGSLHRRPLADLARPAYPGGAGTNAAIAVEAGHAKRREATVIVVTIGAIIYFSLRSSSFYSTANIIVMVQYIAPIMVIGAGETLMLVLSRWTCDRPGVPDLSVVHVLVLVGGRASGLCHRYRLGPLYCHRAYKRPLHRPPAGAIPHRDAGHPVHLFRTGIGQVQPNPGRHAGHYGHLR